MKPETERLLGTLELLSYNRYIKYKNTFSWEKEKQGDLNLWNLMSYQDFIEKTDIELVIEHWQNIEKWGTPTSQINGEYAPKREDREDNDWNDDIAKQRKVYYQRLKEICLNNLQYIQAYRLRANEFLRRYLPNFYVSIIIGKNKSRQWLCLLPTINNICFGEKYNISARSENDINDLILPQLDSILSQLKPLTIYSYYYDGYKQTHQHQIVKGLGTTKEEAVTSALQKSGMVTWRLTTEEFSHLIIGMNTNKVANFMNQSLQNRTYCSISFWDVGCSFEFGKTPDNDWIGIRKVEEFNYNP